MLELVIFLLRGRQHRDMEEEVTYDSNVMMELSAVTQSPASSRTNTQKGVVAAHETEEVR